MRPQTMRTTHTSMPRNNTYTNNHKIHVEGARTYNPDLDPNDHPP